ncbi:MAG: helix-hairpin-helix domain-containing protein, partial [Thermoplasmata archaeon]|nr:helix-hairpin-helix domain-containing protein [Thermoplasmata archaeon]
MSTNSDLADIFREIADLLDLAGEKFKPEAYRRAARSLDSLTEDVRAVSGRGELDSIPGVGAAISEKIREYLQTGGIEYHARIRRSVPPGILEIMRLPGIGPKTARRFWIEVGVEGPQELMAAVEAGRLAGLKGFGPRKIELVRKALQPASTPGPRTPLRVAALRADAIVGALRAASPVDQIEVAGSLRRGRESVGDIDILVTSTEPERVFDAFSALPDRREITLRGPTKETIVFADGIQVDL